jgi:hypothetical protein
MTTRISALVLALVATAATSAHAQSEVETTIAPIGITVEASPEGVRVSRVSQGSPAETGGIKAGDVIVAFGSIDVRSPAHLAALATNVWELARDHRDSDVVTKVEVLLANDTESVTIALTPRPEPTVGITAEHTPPSVVGVSTGVGAALGLVVGIILVGASCSSAGGNYGPDLGCSPLFLLAGGALGALVGALAGVAVGGAITGIHALAPGPEPYAMGPTRTRPRFNFAWSWSF